MTPQGRKRYPHGMAIQTLEMEIGRLKFCAGSDRTTSQRREVIRMQVEEMEQTTLFLKSRCES